MKVVVFGSTGGTGRAVVRTLLAGGHQVTAFARDPAKMEMQTRLSLVVGDVMNPANVARAVAGQDAVVVALGNSQNPFAMLLGAKRTTPANICEAGTANVIAAMQTASVRRLVCVTSFGVGETREKLPLVWKLFFRALLREQMQDKERQETVVRASGLDWTLVQPVGLDDTPATGAFLASRSGARRKAMISRADVAAFIAQEVTGPGHVGQTVTVSG